VEPCDGSTRRAPAPRWNTSLYSEEWVRLQKGHCQYRTGLPAADHVVMRTWQCVHSTSWDMTSADISPPAQTVK